MRQHPYDPKCRCRRCKAVAKMTFDPPPHWNCYDGALGVPDIPTAILHATLAAKAKEKPNDAKRTT